MQTYTLALPRINHDQAGFEALARLYAWVYTRSPSNIVIDMRKTNWIDADMCAPLGGIVCLLEQKLNRLEFVSADDKLNYVLMRNGFLSYHGGEKIPDTWDTTIAYRRFAIEDEIAFSSYIFNELMQHPKVTNMQSKAQKDFSKNISEIFNNATQHARTQLGVFSCGQFFPNQQNLAFTVADMGIGIHQSVGNFLRRNITAVEAIRWAVEGNTTKQGVPGGMGLQHLNWFFDANAGCVRIVSGNGYWVKRKGQVDYVSLAHSLPGTVVSLEVSVNG